MAKRILWLFNHTSLRKFEVPMLIDMGYEVFCPKKWNFLDFSASVTYEYDNSLTIPENDLSILNNVDFYKTISNDVMKLINKHFDIAICMLQNEMLESFLKSFKGCVVLHNVGLFGKNTCTDWMIGECGCDSARFGMITLCKDLGERFWYGSCYDNFAECECSVLKHRDVYLPIGFKDSNIVKTWVGGDKRILFVSPKIKTSPYYTKVYENFLKNFGNLPHVIGGAQPQPVPEDDTVTGFLTSEQYEYNMNHLAGMFYHSQEPRHLHYHPLEAIKQGMPLIFMSGGMLDHLEGVGLPGRAKTFKDAYKKLQKLINGDRSFINEILDTQDILLEKFKMDYCRPLWEEGMKKIDNVVLKLKNNRGEYINNKKRIGIILPAPYTGGVLDYSIRFVISLNKALKSNGSNMELVFAFPKHQAYDERDYFGKIRKEGIQLREFTCDIKDKDWAIRALKLSGYISKLNEGDFAERYVVFNDGGNFFQDCDHLIFTADASMVGAPFFCLKPYSVVVHDYIQRYVPEAISRETRQIKLINQKAASKVLVTSLPTKMDAIQFAGINPNRVILTPLLLEYINDSNYKNLCNSGREYFLWSTNAAPHKNHLKALYGLEQYYRNGGKYDCVITGSNTKYFKCEQDLCGAPVIEDYIKKIQNIINNSELLKKHILIKGDLSKSDYIDILANAKFVFHPGYGDNGNGTVVDAAGFGIPSLSSDYPAMRYLSSFMGIPLCYMSPFDADDIAKAIMDMEQKNNVYSQNMPDYNMLKKNDYLEKSQDLLDCITTIIGL